MAPLMCGVYVCLGRQEKIGTRGQRKEEKNSNCEQIHIFVFFVRGYSSLLTKTKAFILILALKSNLIEADQILCK